MFRLLFAVGLVSASGHGAHQTDVPTHQTHEGLASTSCTLQSAEAVNDLLDSAVFIWAAAKRCGKPGDAVKCEVDISSAIESLNAMANVLVSAVRSCGHLVVDHSGHGECGITVSELTESAAGLAAASGELAESCEAFGHASEGAHESSHNSAHSIEARRLFEHAVADHAHADDADPVHHHAPADPAHGHDTNPVHDRAMATHAQTSSHTADAVSSETAAFHQPSVPQIATCVVDLKHSFGSLFSVVQKTMTISEHCTGGEEACIDRSLNVVEAFSALGEYLAGTVGHCSASSQKTKRSAGCASAVMSLVHNLNRVAETGRKMSKVCIAHSSAAPASRILGHGAVHESSIHHGPAGHQSSHAASPAHEAHHVEHGHAAHSAATTQYQSMLPAASAPVSTHPDVTHDFLTPHVDAGAGAQSGIVPQELYSEPHAASISYGDYNYQGSPNGASATHDIIPETLYDAKSGPIAKDKTMQYVFFALIGAVPISGILAFAAGRRSGRSIAHSDLPAALPTSDMSVRVDAQTSFGDIENGVVDVLVE